MLIPNEILSESKSLNMKGLHLQAYKKLTSICPLEEIEDIESILLASGITHNLGANDASRKFAFKAWRMDNTHPKAMFYKASEIFHNKGALPALMFTRKNDLKFKGDAEITSWWHSLKVELYAFLRDFKQADIWHKKAVEAKEDEPWVWVSQARSLENQDRYEDSFKASHKAYKIDQNNRTAIFSLAHSLIISKRDEEALKLLEHFAKKFENVWLLKQLADLQTEANIHDKAYSNYRRILEIAPIKEEGFNEWLYASLSDSAYKNGDINKSIEYAEISKNKFHKRIVDHLKKSDPKKKRKLLNVGFVRQHHMTCAPATVTNISRYWKKKAEHLDVANEMCYDGTPAYRERGWADKNGWITKEFKINFENSKALIDRGIPFTLTTIQPGNGHLQAIMGYDERRNTLLIRDPYYKHISEYEADGLLKDQESTGPRGMVLVPLEHSHLLDGLQFQEDEQYDYLYRIDTLLDEYKREDALKVLEEMKAKFPTHRLTWSAHWALARFDSNNVALLKSIEQLREKFPDDVNLKLSFLSVSDEFVSREERLRVLEDFCKDEKTDPLLWQMFGYELSRDAEEYDKALRWLYKTIRFLPTTGATYRFLGDIFWSRRMYDDATKLYRIAACLQDKDEQFAYTYFLAERHLNRTEEALDFLRDRYERFGHLSYLPVQTLFHALRELGRVPEAFEFIEDAIKKRPDDGELKIFAAEAKARFGKKDEAKLLLEETRQKTSPQNWFMTAALIEELEGNFKKCLEYWREIVKLDPLSYDGHERIASMLSIIEGKESAQKYLQKVTRKFPHNRSLIKLRLSYLHENITEGIAVLRHLVQLDPRDAWSQRELSRWLLRVKKYDKAFEASQIALKIDPNDALNHWIYGTVLEATDKKSEAAEAYKKALTLNADAEYALACWMDMCRTIDEKKDVLQFARTQLETQKVFGSGITSYRQYAKNIIKPQILLDELKNIYSQNKDLRESYSVIIEQLIDMNQLDDALKFAQTAVNKFPLMYETWADLASVHRYRGENEKDIEALQRSLEIYENWAYGIQLLSDAFVRGGRLEDAKQILQDAVRRIPLDNYLYGCLADILWQLDEKNEAIETAKRAITLDPEYEWAWRMIKFWSEDIDQPNLAAELAKQLTIDKPKDAKTHLIYAEALEMDEFSQEYHDAIEKVLELDPQNVRALARKANLLADTGKFSEAFEVCNTKLSDGFVPEQLRYVRARIESKRGNQGECIKILEDITKTAPDYYPAWEQLASFYSDSEERKKDYLRVTRGMARLAPQNPVTLGYFGEACLNNGKREEAKQVFRQAINASPDYEFGGLSLFDLHLEDNEFEEAASVLDILKTFIKNDNSLLKEIFFNAKQGKLNDTEELFRNLCHSETAQVHNFQYLFQQLKDFDVLHKPFVDKVIEESFYDADANPYIGRIFIEKCWEKYGDKNCIERLQDIRKNQNVWAKGMSRLIELMTHDKSVGDLTNFIYNNKQDLKSDTEVWAMGGYAFVTINDFESCKNWLADWKERDDIKPWMLWNYSLALKNTNEEAKSLQINKKALEMPFDDVTFLHLLFLGLSEIHKGNYQEAFSYIARINPEVFNDWELFFYQLFDLGLLIYEKLSNGENEEADQLIKQLVKLGTSDRSVRKEKIMRDQFDKSLEAALNLTDNSWVKLSVKSRLFFSKLGI